MACIGILPLGWDSALLLFLHLLSHLTASVFQENGGEKSVVTMGREEGREMEWRRRRRAKQPALAVLHLLHCTTPSLPFQLLLPLTIKA